MQAPATRDLNLRGIYWKVTEAGEVSVVDPIEVVSRGADTPPLEGRLSSGVLKPWKG